MTTQPLATPTPPQSPLFRFIREHPALVLGGVPVTLTMIRLLLVSQGDDAALAVLAQNLNVTTILVVTLTTSLPALLLVLGLLVVQGEGGRLLPHDMPPARRRSYFIVAFSYTFLLMLLISWRMVVIWLVVTAAIVGIGLLSRWLWHRRDDTYSQPLVEPEVLVVTVISSLVLLGPWLPAERITLSNSSVRVGYVVANGDPMTVLWREGGVVYLRTKDIKDRKICARTGGLGPGIMSLRSDKTEPCPSDKVTRLKP